jgi:glycosyltransferase involved in cell wall biosynthesis
MMLRKGAHKRLHDYHRFIELARGSGRELRLAVISPDAELIAAVRDSVSVSLLRPTLAQMRSLYQRTRCFVHLSEHEGFGLPPLEAMGAGCIPLCRDSGGVRAFMATPELDGLLLPAQTSVAEVLQRGCELLDDPARLRDCSARAREIFRRGAEATARTSAALVSALSRA